MDFSSVFRRKHSKIQRLRDRERQAPFGPMPRNRMKLEQPCNPRVVFGWIERSPIPPAAAAR
jgi:hypothetical protein